MSARCRTKNPSRCRYHGDKYFMTHDENVFFARRNVVSLIQRQANLENIAITMPDTQEILENRSITGISMMDAFTVVDLKRAWDFVLTESYRLPVYDDMLAVNARIGDGGVVPYAGELRSRIVTIGGAPWIPPVPVDSVLRDEFDDIMSSSQSITMRALDMFCMIAKAQPFNDGNKRTATLMANWMLIHNGAGLLSIPNDRKHEYGTLLVGYYDSGDDAALCGFLRTMISGIR